MSKLSGGEMSFDTDLQTGQQWENVAILILQSMGYKFVDRCFDGGWDIIMKYRNTFETETFEIKTDFTRTDNIVIEFECNKEPSGIETSEAIIWCFLFPYDWQAWLIDALKLKELCVDANTISGGYKNRSKMYVFNKLDVISNFQVIEYRNLLIKSIPTSLEMPEFIKKELQ